MNDAVTPQTKAGRDAQAMWHADITAMGNTTFRERLAARVEANRQIVAIECEARTPSNDTPANAEARPDEVGLLAAHVFALRDALDVMVRAMAGSYAADFRNRAKYPSPNEAMDKAMAVLSDTAQAAEEARAHIRDEAIRDGIAAIEKANTAGGSCKSHATGALRALLDEAKS